MTKKVNKKTVMSKKVNKKVKRKKKRMEPDNQPEYEGGKSEQNTESDDGAFTKDAPVAVSETEAEPPEPNAVKEASASESQNAVESTSDMDEETSEEELKEQKEEPKTNEPENVSQKDDKKKHKKSGFLRFFFFAAALILCGVSMPLLFYGEQSYRIASAIIFLSSVLVAVKTIKSGSQTSAKSEETTVSEPGSKSEQQEDTVETRSFESYLTDTETNEEDKTETASDSDASIEDSESKQDVEPTDPDKTEEEKQTDQTNIVPASSDEKSLEKPSAFRAFLLIMTIILCSTGLALVSLENESYRFMGGACLISALVFAVILRIVNSQNPSNDNTPSQNTEEETNQTQIKALEPEQTEEEAMVALSASEPIQDFEPDLADTETNEEEAETEPVSDDSIEDSDSEQDDEPIVPDWLEGEETETTEAEVSTAADEHASCEAENEKQLIVEESMFTIAVPVGYKRERRVSIDKTEILTALNRTKEPAIQQTPIQEDVFAADVTEDATPEVDEVFPESDESAEHISIQQDAEESSAPESDAQQKQEQELLKLLDMLSSETEEPSEEDMVSEPAESGNVAVEEQKNTDAESAAETEDPKADDSHDQSAEEKPNDYVAGEDEDDEPDYASIPEQYVSYAVASNRPRRRMFSRSDTEKGSVEEIQADASASESPLYNKVEVPILEQQEPSSMEEEQRRMEQMPQTKKHRSRTLYQLLLIIAIVIGLAAAASQIRNKPFTTSASAVGTEQETQDQEPVQVLDETADEVELGTRLLSGMDLVYTPHGEFAGFAADSESMFDGGYVTDINGKETLSISDLSMISRTVLKTPAEKGDLLIQDTSYIVRYNGYDCYNGKGALALHVENNTNSALYIWAHDNGYVNGIAVPMRSYEAVESHSDGVVWLVPQTELLGVTNPESVASIVVDLDVVSRVNNTYRAISDSNHVELLADGKNETALPRTKLFEDEKVRCDIIAKVSDDNYNGVFLLLENKTEDALGVLLNANTDGFDNMHRESLMLNPHGFGIADMLVWTDLLTDELEKAGKDAVLKEMGVELQYTTSDWLTELGAAVMPRIPFLNKEARRT